MHMVSYGVISVLIGIWMEQGNHLGVTSREEAHHQGECVTVVLGTITSGSTP
jgi:hypothetical protein